MKKIALLLLVVALVFTLFVFTGCGEDDVDTNTDSENVNTDTNTDSNTQEPGADEDLQAAYDYIKLTYKTLNVTSSNFELMKNAPIGDKVFAITWSTDNEAVTITETEDGNFYVVNIPALGDDVVNYSLKFSIQNEAGEKKEGSFNLTIPKFAVNTFEEYVAAEDGTPLIIQGIVTGVISKSTNSTKENSLFIQDLNGNGGYYAYNLAEDPNGTISVGMTVEVRGNKKNYNGTFELTSPVATVIDSTIKTVTPVDFTATLAGASSLEDKALTGKNGMLVTIKGVTILEYVDGNGYHYFQFGDLKSYLRVSSSSNCITKEEGETLTSNFVKNFYNGADVTGIIAVYNNSFYLMPISAEPFTNIVELEKPADVKVDTALSNTKLPSMIQIAGDVELPTTFSGFADVTLAWELVATEGVNCATINGNKLAVTIPTEAQVVTLKATATCGEVSDSKEFTITVKPIKTITILEANNIGMNMAHNTYTDELYYITGTVDEVVNTTYGNLYLVDGEYSIYIYGIYDATGDVRYDKMNPQPLTKDTITVLSSVGKYSNDVQLKNAKVVSHTVHEDNVNQEPEEPVDFKPVNPIVGTKYYFGMVKNGSVYYITGAMGSGNAQYYMATTNKQEDSATITVVAGPTDDTYYITLTVGGATKYMDIVVSGTHKNAVYVDEAPEVGFSFDSEFKVFYKVIEESNYTFGTGLSGNFTTVGGVKVSEENAMLQIAFVDEHTCTFTDVVTNPTCTEDGYTTHTCPCGNVVVDTKVNALGHDFVSGVCSVCGATDHEHVYDSVVTDPTCTEAGYTTYTCNVPNCGDTYTEPGAAATGEHADKNGDFKCDGCNKAILPADGSTLTIEQALAIGAAHAHNTYTTEKYYVTGTITEVYNTQYGNLYITDGTNTITVYGLYKDGTRYDAMTVKPVVGDTITVYGTIGQYNGTPQFKSAELAEHTAHTCVGGEEATCTTAQTCTTCGKTMVNALGHSVGDDGKCTRCSYDENNVVEESVLEVFEFGENGASGHVDGNDISTSKTYEGTNYDLVITNASKAYDGGKDETGKSFLKLGTSSVAGTITFTVDDDVNKVVIKVAGYKAKTSKYTINGGNAVTIETSSNNGEYTEVVIDTTSVKTITFATVSGATRCVIDSITFIG